MKDFTKWGFKDLSFIISNHYEKIVDDKDKNILQSYLFSAPYAIQLPSSHFQIPPPSFPSIPSPPLYSHIFLFLFFCLYFLIFSRLLFTFSIHPLFFPFIFPSSSLQLLYTFSIHPRTSFLFPFAFLPSLHFLFTFSFHPPLLYSLSLNHLPSLYFLHGLGRVPLTNRSKIHDKNGLLENDCDNFVPNPTLIKTCFFNLRPKNCRPFDKKFSKIL